MSINKKELTERDICTKFITPALVDAKWDLMNQIREEVSFTKATANGKDSIRNRVRSPRRIIVRRDQIKSRATTKRSPSTAPLREENRDTYLYFGNPIYTHSLRQGIDDGFLAPYRVHRIISEWDAAGWRPSKDELDRYGCPIPDEEYGTKDFERTVALRARTEAIAKHLTDFLKKHDRFAKTVVFCVDQEHADEMRRALNNLNSDLVGIAGVSPAPSSVSRDGTNVTQRKTPPTLPEIIENIWQNVDRDYHDKVLAKRLLRIDEDITASGSEPNLLWF